MRRLWSPVILAVLVVSFFGHVLFSDRILLHRDLFSFMYPLHHYWVDHVRQGIIPPLNTAINGGQPVLVNPNYNSFYPLNLLYFIFDFDTAWNLTLVVHIFWAGLGMYYFSTVMGFTKVASLSSAITFAFGGPLLSSMSYYISVIGLSWLPWILALSYKGVRVGGRWVAAAALALAAQALSGEANIISGTAILLLLLLLFLRYETGNTKSIAVRGGVIVVLGFIVACVQILPSMLWIPHSGRSVQLDFEQSAAYWSLYPVRLIELIVPRFFGNVMSDFAPEYWGSAFADSGYPYVMMTYAGILPLLLAPVAWRNRWGKWAVSIAVVAALLSLGRWLPGYRALYDYIPLFQTLRYPEKFMFFAHFALSATVAVAVSQLPQTKWKQLWPSLLLLASFLTIVAVFVLHTWPSGLSDPQRAYQSRALMTAAATALTASILLAAIIKLPRLVMLVPILILFDLCSYTWDLAQNDSRDLVSKQPEVINRIPELRGYPILHLGNQQSDRYFLPGLPPPYYMKEALEPLLGLNWGIQYGAARDIDRLGWRTSSMRQSWIQQKFPGPEALHWMRQSGIARVISLTSINQAQLFLETQITLRGNKQIYVYRLNPPPYSFIRWQQGKGQLRWAIQQGERISIEIRDATGGILIVSRNALPGWICTLNGRKVAFQSTPEGWMAIDVPQGNHHIELVFRTPGLLAGSILTAIGTLIAAALLVFG